MKPAKAPYIVLHPTASNKKKVAQLVLHDGAQRATLDLTESSSQLAYLLVKGSVQGEREETSLGIAACDLAHLSTGIVLSVTDPTSVGGKSSIGDGEPSNDVVEQLVTDVREPPQRILLREIVHRCQPHDGALDSEAFLQIRARQATLAELQSAGTINPAQLTELEFIADYLKQSTYRGRAKTLVQPAGESLRQSVSTNIRRALDRIEKQAPETAASLRSQISLGTWIRFTGPAWGFVVQPPVTALNDKEEIK